MVIAIAIAITGQAWTLITAGEKACTSCFALKGVLVDGLRRRHPLFSRSPGVRHTCCSGYSSGSLSSGGGQDVSAGCVQVRGHGRQVLGQSVQHPVRPIANRSGVGVA